MSSTVDTQDLSELRAQLQFDFPDAPAGMIDNAIIFAARKICEHSVIETWIDLTDDLQGCEQDYDFKDYLPEGLELCGVRVVEYCGCCIPDVDPKCNPCARGWSLSDDTTISLWPEPPNDVAGYTLRICISLKPKLSACTIPTKLVGSFSDIIQDFARSRILRAPNQPWTNTREGLTYQRIAQGNLNGAVRRIRRNKSQRGVRQAGIGRWVF